MHYVLIIKLMPRYGEIVVAAVPEPVFPIDVEVVVFVLVDTDMPVTAEPVFG